MPPKKIRRPDGCALRAAALASSVLAGSACEVGDGGDSSGFASAGEGLTSAEEATDSSDDETTEAGDDGLDTTTDTGEAESDSGFTGGTTTTGGGQPPSGMYAQCTTDPSVCIPLDTCVQLMNPMTMQIVDGFCSATGCVNAPSQCAPAPGGTAVPACVAFGPDSVCALDCSGGKTCPGGMQCYNLGGPQICA